MAHSRASWAFGMVAVLPLAGCPTPPDESAAPAASTSPIEGAPHVVAWPDTGGQAAEPTLPWTSEAFSAVVAIAVVGQPFAQGGEELLTLQVEDVIKGKLALGGLVTKDHAPFLGCLPPPSIPKPSERFPPGTRVLVYLTGGELSLHELRPLPDDESTAAHVRRLRAWVAFFEGLAGQPDWAQVLPVDRVLTMDEAWALFHADAPGTLAATWRLLEHTVTRAQVSPEHVEALNRVLWSRAKLEAAVGAETVAKGIEAARGRAETRPFAEHLD